MRRSMRRRLALGRFALAWALGRRFAFDFECGGPVSLLVVLVCVGTQCVPGVATCVVAKIYRPIFLYFIIHVSGVVHARVGRIVLLCNEFKTLFVRQLLFR